MKMKFSREKAAFMIATAGALILTLVAPSHSLAVAEHFVAAVLAALLVRSHIG